MTTKLALWVAHIVLAWVANWKLIILHFPVDIPGSNIFLILQYAFDSTILSTELISMSKQPWRAWSIHLFILVESCHAFFSRGYIFASFLRLFVGIRSSECLLFLGWLRLLHLLQDPLVIELLELYSILILTFIQGITLDDRKLLKATFWNLT